MDDDQQFCLRWNNHQSTLVSVFDTLLEKGVLVDCTLAAEGKYLDAHKVVLSACSPYFEALLSKHYDKHPVLILKDVKFQELRAMMDYMYRGEVNISQDQLGALLKAAESLQIKGLSDNKRAETESRDRKPAPPPPSPKSPQPAASIPRVQGLSIEQRSRDDSRDGSVSPGPRKKKRPRRKSEELDNHDASNSSESHSLPAQNIPSLPTVTKMNADVPDQLESQSEILTRHKQSDELSQVPIKEKIETHTELILEPKSEYVEEMNEDSVEDLTLDDDDLSNMEQMDDGAGPSHGNAGGEGPSQGFGGWHMGNQSQDEVFLAAQEAVGAHRDSQAEDLSLKKSSWENWPSHLVLPMMLMRENMKQSMLQSINRGTLDLSLSPRSKGRFGDVSPTPGAGGGFVCAVCGRTYKLKSSLRNHQKWECGKEPQFKCPYCVYKAKQKMHMARHMERMHREIDCSIVKTELKTETKSSEDRDQDNIENKRIESNNDNSNSFSNLSSN